MADQIRTNYQALEDMAKQCDSVANRLAQTAAVSQKVAGQMQNGALIGRHGDVFVQALGIFFTKVMKLSEKYREVAKDIRAAAQDMQRADSTAGAKF
jgi:WXG100 family type VII secretion target